MKFYFGTILLEANRWNKSCCPVYNPTDWLFQIEEAGYRGVELWENHMALMNTADREKLKKAFPGDIIYNTYDRFTDDTADFRKNVLAGIDDLNASGVKFNFGPEGARIDEYRRNFSAFAKDLPRDFRLICECHAKTVCEEPERAAEILSSLDDPRVEALVHLNQDADIMTRWFDALGEKITHCHANLFRCEKDPWTEEDALGFDLIRTIKCLGRSSVKTVTLEFTRGVGEAPEDRQKLFNRAFNDKNHLEKELGLS